MDPSIIVAALATLQIIWQAVAKYRAEKPKLIAETQTTLAGVVDGRIALILNNNAAEITRLQAEIARLTAELEAREEP